MCLQRWLWHRKRLYKSYWTHLIRFFGFSFPFSFWFLKFYSPSEGQLISDWEDFHFETLNSSWFNHETAESLSRDSWIYFAVNFTFNLSVYSACGWSTKIYFFAPKIYAASAFVLPPSSLFLLLSFFFFFFFFLFFFFFFFSFRFIFEFSMSLDNSRPISWSSPVNYWWRRWRRWRWWRWWRQFQLIQRWWMVGHVLKQKSIVSRRQSIEHRLWRALLLPPSSFLLPPSSFALLIDPPTVSRIKCGSLHAPTDSSGRSRRWWIINSHRIMMERLE